MLSIYPRNQSVSAREGIHRPANGYADQQEEEQGPDDVFHSVEGAAATQETESYGDDQGKEHHCLKVRELEWHGAVYAFRPRAAS
jgi:hypothetical protein